MTRVLFIHGWAYTPDMWHKLAASLQGAECSFVDLGFFGAPQLYEGAFECVITHSYGLMWLLQQDKITSDKIVSVSGIASYVRSNSQAIPKSQIRAMDLSLRRHPETLLHDFYEACGDDRPPTPDAPNIDTLSQALKDMETLDLTPALADKQVLALASTGDKIVPQALTRGIFSGEKIHWHESDSHILPVKDPAWCAHHIQEFINA